MIVVTAAEMRRLDRQTIDDIGVPGVVLMESAGRGVVDLIARLTPAGARVAVFAGPGNNGGDGFVVARHLANRGGPVEVILCAARARVRGDALTHLLACERSQVAILDGSTAAGLASAAAAVESAAVVVDALFGTGLERPVEGVFERAIGHINAHRGLKIAVDVPSGLDSDRGIPLGPCVSADHTVTFGFPKRGLVGAPGFALAGTLHIVDIGIPERLARELRTVLLEAPILDPLASFDPQAHKGTRGHLLVLAGSRGKTGAALLCGTAALRAGAGLCTVASPADARAALEGRVPELMTADYGPGLEGAAWSALEPLLDGKRALAAGPGIPTDPAMRAVLGRLCRAARARSLPVVLDADALNHLAAEPALLDGGGAFVLTPHPGEAARLLGRPTAEVQADRYRAASELATRFSAVVALKGARTVVAAPDGSIAVCPTGGPALGTAGTGDVLTGVTGALLARGLAPFEAACAAVYLHGAAGDLAAAERSTILARDVIEALPRVLFARRQ